MVFDQNHHRFGGCDSLTDSNDASVLKRQISEKARDAKVKLMNSIHQSALGVLEEKSFKVQLARLNDLHRKISIRGLNNLAEIYLENCKLLELDQSELVNILSQEFEEFVIWGQKLHLSTLDMLAIGLSVQDKAHFDNAKKTNPYVDKRAMEIVENAKEGFCNGVLVYRKEKNQSFILEFWGDQWKKILTASILGVGTLLLAFLK